MQLNSDSMRDFLSNFTNFDEINSDLDTLVVQYRETQDPRKLGTICNKVLGVILKYGRRAHDGLCDQDIYSRGFEALLYAVADKGWKSDGKVKFITYFTCSVINAMTSLQQKKCFRDAYKYQVSLDALIDDPDTNFDVSEDERFIPASGGYFPVKSKDDESKDVEENKDISSKKKDRINSLKYDFEQVYNDQESKINMAMSLGMSLTDLEIELLKFKIKRRYYENDDSTSIMSDKVKLDELRRIQRKQKKELKLKTVK